MRTRQLMVQIAGRGFIGLVLFTFIGFPALIGVAMLTPYDFVGLTDTEFAPGYSWIALHKTSVGDSSADVLGRLGEPLGRFSVGRPNIYTWEDPGVEVVFDDWEVVSVHDPNGILKTRIKPGMGRDKVFAILGDPTSEKSVPDMEAWTYSRSPGSTHYWQANVIFDRRTGRVVRKHQGFYFD